MIERERRFLIDELPDDLLSPKFIEQGYLMTEPASVRVRRSGTDYTLTIKTGSGRRRNEIERTLSDDEFAALWDVASTLRISKRRYLFALGELTAEVDVFDGVLAGHQIVEVEFASDEAAAAFDPPTWFGQEVTDDPRYTNASLAKHGWP